MKRCPQCEFIYEDDQSLCDMDGILLVFDSQQLPQTQQPVTSGKSQGRNRTVPAAATLVLVVVLGLVYYVSTRQQTASGTNYTPAAVSTQPAPTSAPTAPVKEPSPELKPTDPSNGKPAAASTGSPVGVKKSEVKPKATSGQKTIRAAPTQQDDSKIGSLLKKTGRLLKKPFKL
jgi:hypothetical protein